MHALMDFDFNSIVIQGFHEYVHAFVSCTFPALILFHYPFHVYVPPLACTAPAPHSAPILTSTDPHEPMAKQQTMEPSHCQSKSLVCLPIFSETLLCCKASTKAYIRKNELACTYLQDIQTYPFVLFSLHQ